MAHHDAAHASADDEYLETPPGAAYEHTDADVWPIVKFLGWLAISAVVIHFGLGLMYQLLIDQSLTVGEQRYPLAAAQATREHLSTTLRALEARLTEARRTMQEVEVGAEAVVSDAEPQPEPVDADRARQVEAELEALRRSLGQA